MVEHSVIQPNLSFASAQRQVFIVFSNAKTPVTMMSIVSCLHLNRNFDSSERDCRIRPSAVGGLTKRIRNVDHLTIYKYS